MQQLTLSQATAAQRRVPLYLVDATDGVTPETGVVLGAADIQVSKNGGAEANSAGVVTEVGAGLYYYEFTAAELDTLGFITARVVKAGVRTFVAAVQVASAGGGGGGGAGEYDARFNSIDTQLDVIELAVGATTTGRFNAIDTQLDVIEARANAVPTATQNADALLARHVLGGSNIVPTVARALGVNVLKWSINDTVDPPVITFYAADEITPLFTATLQRANVSGITSFDPQ